MKTGIQSGTIGWMSAEQNHKKPIVWTNKASADAVQQPANPDVSVLDGGVEVTNAANVGRDKSADTQATTASKSLNNGLVISDDDLPKEIGGRDGPEPTRFGDWEKNGRCIDF